MSSFSFDGVPSADGGPTDGVGSPDSAESTESAGAADGAMASPDLPVWAIVLGWEMRRGRQVILHGEVNDRSWLSGEPVGLKDVVAAYLEATGTDVVGWWDPVDGLTFPVAGHAERFGRIRRGQAARDEPADPQPREATASEHALHTSAPTLAANDQGIDSGARDRDRPGSRRAAVRQANRDLLAPQDPATAALPADLGATIDLVRSFVTRPQASTAFVFQDLDLALPATDPVTAPLYLRLRNVMRDAVVPAEPFGSPPHRRNPVLLVTGSLDRLPPWFYTEDPRIVPLRLNRPDQAERRLWLSLLAPNFHGAPTERGRGALVGATDGLTAWDLDALARTSVFRRVPADRPARLLDAMRINVRANPWERLDADMVAESAQRLGEHVIGQQRAVEAVADALKTAYVGLDFGSSGSARPRGVFFFVGPTGVGKTELAKSVARLLFGDESAYARFDMSEYREEHAAERLAGAPPGYVGYEAGGELTRRVQERPFSVLLFDEIEKANPVVLDKFLQILEDGRLTDGRGQTAYFSQSLIIFTSNTGAASTWDLEWDRAASPDGPPYELLERHFVAAVEQSFGAIGRPEILGRLRPGIVVFDVLRAEHVASITDRLLDQLAESALERQRVRLEPDRASVHAWMARRMRIPGNARYGGRQIRNELEVLRTGLVRHFVGNRPAPGSIVRFSVDADGALRIDDGAGRIADPWHAAYDGIGPR